MNTQFAIRKENMMKLIMEKYKGNKAAFSRAIATHPNHVNLLASDNPALMRNMGEELARRVEAAIGLPEGWMDVLHSAEVKSFTIPSKVVDPSVSRAIIHCEDYAAITVTNKWMGKVASQVTHFESLILATVASKEMEPLLWQFSTVVIDTGAKGISNDGIYILTKGDYTCIRQVRRSSDGHTLSTPNPDFKTDKPETMKGMKVVGKVVSRMQDMLV